MLDIQFDPWSQTGNIATVTWQVRDLLGEGIASVEAAIYKDGDVPTYTSAAGGYERSIDVSQYNGLIHVTVHATNFGGQVATSTTSHQAANYTPPSSPDFATFSELGPMGVTIAWGVRNPDPVTTGWRLVNVDDQGVQQVLGDASAGDRSKALVLDTSTLRTVLIFGMDDFGHLSAPGPVLVFASQAGGPVIGALAIEVRGNMADVSWVVSSRELLTDVRWHFQAGSAEAHGQGLAQDSASFPITSFFGVVSFDLTAIDNQGRASRAGTSRVVHNVPPLRPTLVVEEIGIAFVRLRVEPDPLETSPIQQVDVYGPGGSVDHLLVAPYVLNFGGLEAATTYSFKAQLRNDTGLMSPPTSALVVKTMTNPVVATPAGPSYVGGPLLPRLRAILTEDIRHYVLQLYSDTRLRLSDAVQVVEPPPGFDMVVDFMAKVGPIFGTVLRAEVKDQETYRASLVIDRTGDPLEKLAIFCERIEFGAIWNS